MLNTSAWRPFPRYMAEPAVDDAADDLHEDVTPSEHDLIVRYTIIGIFVILATAALYLTRVIALPITAGIIFGLVLGPAVDSLVRRSVPQHLAAAIVVLAFLSVIVSAIMVLAVPVAGWSDQGPAMVAALKSKLAGIFVMMEDAKDAIGSLMGKSGTDRVKLHFEVRQRGTAVDPARYLSPR